MYIAVTVEDFLILENNLKVIFLLLKKNYYMVFVQAAHK